MKKPLDFIEALCKERLFNVALAPYIMLFCAHPDDEVLGSGVLLSYLKNKIEVVTITDGSPKNLNDAIAAGFSSRESYSEVRYAEQLNAMQKAGIDAERCHWFGLTDQDSSYHMPGIAYRIMELIEFKKPDLILTHAFEGGHPDHDTTAFSVWAACSLLLKKSIEPPEVIEFASYHGNGGAERIYFDFITYPDSRIWYVKLKQKEIESKKRMIDCYKSQWKMLSSIPIGLECYRKAPKYNFKKPPHSGILHYEFYDWGMSANSWNKLAMETIKLLKIDAFNE